MSRIVVCGAVISAALCGCQQHPVAERQIESAPYEITTDGTLKVREDLACLLQYTPARIEAVSGELMGYGKLAFAPGASYDVRLPFEGIVESVEVKNGADVVEGQLLARLRSRGLAKLRADQTRLSGTLDAEQKTLDRLEPLVASGSIAERQVREKRAHVAALEAELAGIRSELSAAKADLDGDDLYLVKADRPGQVLVRNIEPGEHIDSKLDTPAFTIGDPTRLLVTAQFPERDTPLLKVDQLAKVRLPALQDEELECKVTAIMRAIDSDSRTSRVECHLAQPDTRLSSEMAARVNVQVVGAPQLVVPHSAVLLRRESRVVLVRRNDNELERRPIQLGARIGDKVQIISGLSEGEQVVVDGAVLLDGELDRLIASI